MRLSNAYGYRLDWVVSFVAAARHGSFSAAAKEVFRSQPRISTHIADLERALGTQLFDRSVHPLALTADGRALLPHAEAILDHLGLLVEQAGGAGGAVRGEVRVGAYPSAAAWLLPPVARALAREHPGIRLVLREGPSVLLEADLTRGDVDLAVRPLLPLVADDRLEHRVLWHEPLVAVVPAGHPLAGTGPVALADLASLPLISIGESAGPHTGQYESNLAFAAAGRRPEVAYRTNQPQTLVSLVRGRLGVGVTNALAMTTANLDGVRLVRLADAAVDRQVALFWRSDRPQSSAVDRVAEAIGRVPAPTWPGPVAGG